MNNKITKFRNSLIQILKDKNTSLLELSEKLNVPYTTFRRNLYSEHFYTIKDCLDICNILKIDFLDLMPKEFKEQKK
jgi:transcriptional regulator with XRE-family HTH domain